MDISQYINEPVVVRAKSKTSDETLYYYGIVRNVELAEQVVYFVDIGSGRIYDHEVITIEKRKI